MSIPVMLMFSALGFDVLLYTLSKNNSCTISVGQSVIDIVLWSVEFLLVLPNTLLLASNSLIR